MSFFDFGNKPAVVPQNTKSVATFMLTPSGKMKLKNLTGTEPEFAVMASILQHQPATIDEISETARLGYSKTKEMVARLAAKEWVTRAGSRGEA